MLKKFGFLVCLVAWHWMLVDRMCELSNDFVFAILVCHSWSVILGKDLDGLALDI